jgi:hypothetical protein
MSIVIVRKLTLSILSINGMRMMRPGPLTPTSRPRRKITALSYSFRILIDDEIIRISKTMITIVVDGNSIKPP